MKKLISIAFAILLIKSFNMRAEESKIQIHFKLLRTTKGFDICRTSGLFCKPTPEQIEEGESLVLTTARIFHRKIKLNTWSTWIYDGNNIVLESVERFKRKG